MSDGVPNLELPKAPEAPQEGADVDALAADRKTYEQSAEYEDAILHAEAGTELEAAQATHAHAVRPQAAQANAQSEKDEIVIEVEKILEDGIGQFYTSLPPEARPVFKKRGEEVAQQIADMVRHLHLKVKKVVKLIADWLRTIPGVNKYFLEQEAKIKADMLKQLVDVRKEESEKIV
jgi:septum formation inhibitor MinC